MGSAGPAFRRALASGVAIPACPLALTADRRLDERRQRALIRYYLAAGAGGLAVGVHTTQFAIREKRLFAPVLELSAKEIRQIGGGDFVRIAGICGETPQALGESEIARELGYDAALLSLGALRNAEVDQLLKHCGAVAQVLPLIGFYLQPSAGGRILPYEFWRRLFDNENVVAVKIAPFNRYQTIDVIRASAEAGRDDLALYTGNDDNIVFDLLSPFEFEAKGKKVRRRIVGGLLGQWAVWTKSAVDLLRKVQGTVEAGGPVPMELLRLGNELTDANGALFDAANGYKGCVPGIHEVLRRQGLLAGTWCLDPEEKLSAGQGEQIDRVCRSYPHLKDDEFVAKHLAEWLS